MFGIGLQEILVIGIIVWLVRRGKVRGTTLVWAGVGLLVLLACVSMATLAWNAAAFRAIVPDGAAEIHSQQVPPVWAIALGPMLIVIVAFVVLLAVVAHRGLGHAFAGGHGHIWPAFLVVPIIAFLMLGGIRYKSYQSASEFNAAQQHAQHQQAAEQQRRWAAAQVEQAKAYQKQVTEQAKQMAANVEEAVKNATISHRIDQADIHQLMDEFDGPRIVLQAPLVPTAAPAALIMAAAASAAKEAAEAPADRDMTAKKDTKKEAKTKTMTLKSSAGDAKHPAAVELKMESSPDGKPGTMTISVEAETPKPPAAPVPPIAPVPPNLAAKRSATIKPEKPLAVEREPRVVKSGTTPPTWINDPPKRTGDVRREVIATDPFATDDECYHAGDVSLMLKAYDRLEQLTGQTALGLDGSPLPVASQDGAHLARMYAMGMTPEFLRRELVAKDPESNESREYLETVTSSVGPMKKLYMQIEFTPAIDREMMQFAEAYSRQERFAAVGFGAGSVLTLLTMVWGLLKIDTATKGYYTKRLFLGVPAAIIGTGLVLVFSKSIVALIK